MLQLYSLDSTVALTYMRANKRYGGPCQLWNKPADRVDLHSSLITANDFVCSQQLHMESTDEMRQT